MPSAILEQPPARAAREIGFWKALFGVPCLLSLSRIPLAVLFVLSFGHLGIEILILVVSAITDVLDGWYARKHDMVTRVGTVLDPIADKIFAALVVISFVFHHQLSMLGALLLVVREIGELPLAGWYLFTRKGHEAANTRARPNKLGKLATSFQIAALVSAGLDLDPRLTLGLAVATGALGGGAAVGYWYSAMKYRAGEA